MDRRNVPHRILLLFLGTAMLFTALWSVSGTFGSSDPAIRARIARQLLVEGRLTVAGRGSLLAASTFRDRQGEYPSYFGLGQSLFFLPYEAIAIPVSERLTADVAQEERIEEFIVSTLAFVTVLILNFWTCLKLGSVLNLSRGAYLAAFLAVFGSSLWPIAKEGQEEAFLAVLLTTCAYNFIGWQASQKKKPLWLGATASALPLLLRPTTIPVFVGTWLLFAWTVGWDRSLSWGQRFGAVVRISTPFATTATAVLGIVAAYNAFKTGNPFNPGYSKAQGSFDGNLLNGLFEPIFGLDRGVIWQNFWLLPLLAVTLLSWRQLDGKIKSVLGLATFAYFASIGIYCRWSTWAGELSFGSRFQMHVLPLLCVGLCAASFPLLEQQLERLGASRGRTWILAGVCAFAVALQVPSLSLPTTLEEYQSHTADLATKATNGSLTGAIGQMQMRRLNFWAKLTTGNPVSYSLVNPTTQAQIGRYTLNFDDQYSPEILLQKLARWHYWPWLAEGRVAGGTFSLLKALWWLLVGMSLVCWGITFQLLRGHSAPHVT